MKVGDEVNCPHCGRSSFLKKVNVMDGWTKKGDILACAACSAKIADLKLTSKSESEEKSAALSSLKSFLSEEKSEKKICISASDDEKMFCKDCLHFIKHPFADKCAILDKNVSPMDDCENFKRREK
jgi:hypothetical protein